MDDIQFKFSELEKQLRKTTEQTHIDDEWIVESTVQTLWPSYSFKAILGIPNFHELPIKQIPLLTEGDYLDTLRKKNVAQETIDNLSLIEVDYRGFNNQVYTGQIIIHKELVDSIQHIFKRILQETIFPITSIIPVSLYNWDDSLKYNNSGAFEWRFVSGSNEITDHAFGAAIDINPLINPWVGWSSNNASPYDPNSRGTLYPGSPVVEIFEEAGWKWGGNWEHSKDWQHFYRPEIPFKYYGKVEVEE